MNKELHVLKNEIKSLVSKQENNRLRYYYNDSVYNSKYLYMDNIIKSKKINDSCYKDIIMNYFIKSERIMPAGSYVLSKMLLDKINNKKFVLKNVDKSLENIFSIIDDNILEKKYSNLIKNILEFSGPESSIICKKTDNNCIEVVKKENSSFDINLHEDFKNIYFSNQDELTKQFQVIVMDSFIERESEIMSLVDEAYKNKLSLVLICRGISNDFIRNIKSIILKNKISIYPYICKFDDKDPFILSDISAMLGCKIYSAESGDNISKNILEKSTVVKFKISSNKLEFFNNNVSLKKEIDKKLDNCDDIELKNYLNKRKRRLSSNKTIVYVPKSDVKVFNDIKSIIYLYNKIVTSGISCYKENYYPTSCLKRLEKLSCSFIKNLGNIKVVIRL